MFGCLAIKSYICICGAYGFMIIKMRIGATIFMLFVICLHIGDGFKILIYSPTISKSHMLANGRIADTLANAGHNVTVIEPEYMVPSHAIQSTRIAQRIALSNLSSSGFEKMMSKVISRIFDPDPGVINSLFRNYFFMFEAIADSCDEMLEKYSDFWLSLKDEHYDIFMTNQLDTCAPALKHVVQAKSLIWISSSPFLEFMADIVGIPTPTSFVPSAASMFPDISDDMTMYQRFRNMIEHTDNCLSMEYSIARTDVIVRKHFGPNIPSVKTILQDLALIFVIADEFLSFPRPILHNTVYVGGSGVDVGKHELREPYTSEMMKGSKGVVLFSLGSLTDTRSIPVGFKKHLLEAFASLPDYHIIVKADERDAEFADLAVADNIKIVHWAPQPAILAHDRLKLFITHGGYNSLIEVVHAGKPIVCLPLFADQWTNGRLAERNGFGKVFDKRHLIHSSTEFKSLLTDVLEDSKYLKHVLRMRKLIHTKPMSANDRLLAYTNFVGENGNLPELHMSGRKLSSIVYYNLDIFSLIASGILLICVAAFFVGRWLWLQLAAISRTKFGKTD